MDDPRRILETVAELRAELLHFEPTSYSADDCAVLAAALASAEKTCSAARVLAAVRAIACGAHKAHGVADATRWVAGQGGTTMRQAKEAQSTAAALKGSPSTKAALLAGEVSLAQAQEITRAKAELPGVEDELLEAAKNGDLSTLRDEVRTRRMRAVTAGDLHRRQLAARRFRHWRNGLGMVCFQGALPPEAGIPFVARIDHEAARLHRERKRDGNDVPFERCAADALVALTSSSGDGKAKRPVAAELVIVCDLAAWRRGHTHTGEPCHLLGGGPIPVEVAKELSADAFLKVVLHDGKDVQKVAHFGRRYTAELRTALNLGAPPEFSGRACARCKRTFGLQFDHELPVASNGQTSIENLQDLCYPCHADKTERDRNAGLLGPRAKARGPGPP